MNGLLFCLPGSCSNRQFALWANILIDSFGSEMLKGVKNARKL